jgi:hypothetical protein
LPGLFSAIACLFITLSKNKLQNPVLFFDRKKVTVTAPRLPRIPPQTNHKNTTPKNRNYRKTPAKTPLHHERKKAARQPPNRPF